MSKNQKAKDKLVGDKGEPFINPAEYNLSLSSCLNYYNNTFALSDYKNATIDYAASIGIIIPRSIPEWDFRGIGGVCRLLAREQHLSIPHMEHTMKVLRTMSYYVKQPESQPESPKQVNENVDNTIPFITYIEDSIDKVILGKSKELPPLATKYSTYSFNKVDGKRISSYILTTIKSYNDIYNSFDDVDIKEAYSATTKAVIKKMIATLTEFNQTLSKIVVSVKAVAKDKPPLIQVKDLQFLLQYNNFKGIHPKECIGKTEIWVYDTKSRQLSVLRSLSGKIKAAGASFTNIDEDLSVKKILRKEIEQLNNFYGLLEKSKKSYKEFFTAIKTTESSASGRMSSEKIILGAF